MVLMAAAAAAAEGGPTRLPPENEWRRAAGFAGRPEHDQLAGTERAQRASDGEITS
jgi:hypothetical protein